MNEGREKKFRSHILAGIFFLVLLIWIMSINQWNPKGFLTIGALQFMLPAIVMLCGCRNFLLPVVLLLPLYINIRSVFLNIGIPFSIIYPQVFVLLAYLAIFLVALFRLIPGTQKIARSIWFLPGGLAALAIVLPFLFRLLSPILYSIFSAGFVVPNGWYLIHALALLFTGMWAAFPRGIPGAGRKPVPQRAPYAPQGTPAPGGGPRMTTGAPQQAPQRPAGPIPGAAEELKQYKELLDMGAITQEEYDQKKKQLLGL